MLTILSLLPRDTSLMRLVPPLVILHNANQNPSIAIAYWSRCADSLGCILIAPFGTHVKSRHELSFGLTADSVDRFILAAIRHAAARLDRPVNRPVIVGV